MNTLRSWRGKTIAVVGTGATVVAGSANAALDGTAVTALETEVLADVATASGAGFTVFTVVIATSVGFALLSKFINKGANG
ncbi:hypothetical protein [Thalassotalea sp. PLHSN55]|uniref:hypothetical protein n=1 Tax=Thalassotalea sp. PLHSN55 TaxID=3435888 RepID=UPI003F845701